MEGQRWALKNYWKSEKILIKHLYSPRWNFLLHEETALQPLIFKIAWSVLPLWGGIFHILPLDFLSCHRCVTKILPEPVRCRIKPLEMFWGNCVHFCCCSLTISPAPFPLKQWWLVTSYSDLSEMNLSKHRCLARVSVLKWTNRTG